MAEQFNSQNGALRFFADQLGAWTGASFSVWDSQEQLWVMQEKAADMVRFEDFKDAAQHAAFLNKTVGWTY